MKIVNKILIISLIFSLILYTVCRLWVSDGFATAIIFGYVISVLNFVALGKKVNGMLVEGDAAPALFLNTPVRLVLTGVAIVLLIKKMDINVFGLLVGLSVIPVCIPITTLYNYIKGRD
jgi:hypothetical protein